mmetsp:Transcript_10451/g.15706  ORF Transcript_10451/g.15706 Transcript_10451/m.15706 type:complete len:141 (-) Transcript_10451:171-593(-)
MPCLGRRSGEWDGLALGIGSFSVGTNSANNVYATQPAVMKKPTADRKKTIQPRLGAMPERTPNMAVQSVPTKTIFLRPNLSDKTANVVAPSSIPMNTLTPIKLDCAPLKCHVFCSSGNRNAKSIISIASAAHIVPVMMNR